MTPSHLIESAPTSIAAFIGRTRIGPTDRPHLVRTCAEFEDLYGGVWSESPLGACVQHFFRNGGREAYICAIDTGGAPLSPAHVSAPSLKPMRRGLWMLERCEDVSIVCIPPFRSDLDVDRETWDAAIAWAYEHRAIVLVDPPQHWAAAADITSAAVGILVTPHEACANAALYVPRIVCADPLDPGRSAAFVPSGAIAGMMARTDARRGVWKAPAGLEARLEGVEALSMPMTDAEAGVLNGWGINPLRHFPAGLVVWGARTLRGHDQLGSEWKYLPVRRLALLVESSLVRGTRWASTEHGGPALWELLTRVTDAWLLSLFRQGAFPAATPDEAYFVRCDDTTTTDEDVASGVTTLLVGIAPLQAAEFILLKVPVQTRPVECAERSARTLSGGSSGSFRRTSPTATPERDT